MYFWLGVLRPWFIKEVTVTMNHRVMVQCHWDTHCGKWSHICRDVLVVHSGRNSGRLTSRVLLHVLTYEYTAKKGKRRKVQILLPVRLWWQTRIRARLLHKSGPDRCGPDANNFIQQECGKCQTHFGRLVRFHFIAIYANHHKQWFSRLRIK